MRSTQRQEEFFQLSIVDVIAGICKDQQTDKTTIGTRWVWIPQTNILAKILPMTEPNLSGHFDINGRDGCGTTLWHLWHPMALPWVPDTPPSHWTRARSGAETETVLRFSWLMFFYETRWAVGQRSLTGQTLEFVWVIKGFWLTL